MLCSPCPAKQRPKTSLILGASREHHGFVSFSWERFAFFIAGSGVSGRYLDAQRWSSPGITEQVRRQTHHCFQLRFKERKELFRKGFGSTDFDATISSKMLLPWLSSLPFWCSQVLTPYQEIGKAAVESCLKELCTLQTTNSVEFLPRCR